MIDVGTVISEAEAEALAIVQAQKSEGLTGLNPPVGCVIVDKNHRLISLGHTQKPGEAHAEIHALTRLKDKSLLDQARVYVTLEPCSHDGKTGPCAHSLAATSVAEVVVGRADPNPLVNGKGLEILKQANKKVSFFRDESYELKRLLEAFEVNMLQKRCFVAAKMGTSMDGAIALESGESKWITSKESRQYVHELRGRYDALLVGKNTVVEDNPKLNIRAEKYLDKENQVIIVDLKEKVLSSLRSYQLSSHYKEENILGISGLKDSGLGFRKIFISGELNLPKLLKSLYSDYNIGSLFIEGGGYTFSQFLKQGVCDRFYHFIAPSVLGSSSRLFSQDIKLMNLSSKVGFQFDFVRKIGCDLLVESHLK